MTITAKMMKEAIVTLLREEYRDYYNYAAAAEEANDNKASYGVAEYEIAPRHTISGNPFVARF